MFFLLFLFLLFFLFVFLKAWLDIHFQAYAASSLVRLNSCLLQLPDKYSCLAKSDFLLNAAFCLVRLPVKSRFVCFVVVVSFLPFVVVNVVVVVVVVVAAAAAECSFVLTAVPVA